MHIALFHIDAFTEHAFSGNPAAVCFLDFWLDDAFLAKVAAENNMPATAFLVPSEQGYELRWFSPICELKLCGHATLGAAFVLFHFVRPDLEKVLFATRFRGPLTVGRNGDWLSMEFPALAAKACTPPPELLKTLGPSVTSADVVEVFEGSESYVTVLSSANKVQGFQPDFARLEQLHPHVVVLTAPSEEVDFVSRYFAPGYGIPEDFVTGSSHCLLAPIWAHRLGKASLRARQLSPRPGELRCEVADDRVILQGKAVPVMRGSLTI